MKNLKSLTAIALLTGLAGCVPSLHPIYTQKDLIFEPALVGKWSPVEEGEQAEVWTFTQTGDKSYGLTIIEQNQDETVAPAEFEVHLLKLAGYFFLDLYPEPPKNQNDFYSMHLVPAHTFIKMSIEGDILKLTLMDYDWLDKMIERKKVKLKHERIRDEHIVLTAQPKQLQKFIIKYADSNEAFPEPGLMRRVKEKKLPRPLR